MSLSDLAGGVKAGGGESINGQWGEGGAVAKTLDVLSTPQYAVAGSLRALLEHQNPLEGAATGIANRASMRDILSQGGIEGAPNWILGTGLDLATDPVNYIPLVGLATAATRIARVARMGGEVLRPAAEVMAAAGKAGDAGLEMFRLGRRLAARAAATKVLGGLKYVDAPQEVKAAAVGAARAAARNLGPVTSPNWSETMRLLGSTLDDPTTLSSATPGLSRDLDKLYSLVVKKAGEAFRDVTKYGPAGPAFADGLEAAANRMQKLKGERLAYYADHMYDLLHKAPKAVRTKITQVLEGTADVRDLPEEFHGLVERFIRDRQQIYKELSDLGVREIDLQRTGQLMQLPAAEQEVIARVLNGELPPEALAGLRGKLSGNVIAAWLGRGLKVITDADTGTKAVVMDLQEVGQYVPRSLTKAGRDFLQKMSRLDQAEIVRELAGNKDFKHLTVEQLKDLAGSIGSGKFFTPDDIIESFQVRRYGAYQLPSWMWEQDAGIWMKKWYEHSAGRIAHASVWGGANERFAALREGMSHMGSQAVRDLDTAWGHYLGKSPNDDWAGAVARLNKASSLMYLGPRTAIIQLTQLANPMASFGIGNTMAAIGAFVKDIFGSQQLLRQVQRSGALIPSVERLLEGGAATDKIMNWWHTALGIRQMDAAARGISAIAASFRAQELAEQIVKLGGKFTPKIERELAALGLDARALSRQAHGLTDDQLLGAMMRGANLTQFATRTQDLPRMFHGTGGRFFLKFKSFAFQQSGYIKTEITDLLRNKATVGEGIRKGLRYLAAFGWLYSGVAKQLAAFSNKDNPTDDDVAYIHNMLLTGALGVWGDTVVGAAKGNSALWLGFFAGPNAAMLSNVVAAPIAATREGDASKLRPIVPALFRQPWNYGQHALEQ